MTFSPAEPLSLRPLQVRDFSWKEYVGAILSLYLRKAVGKKTLAVAIPVADTQLRLRVSTRREIQRLAKISYEGELLERICSHLDSDDVFFDVVANIGLLGLVIALHDPAKRLQIHGFEPELGNYEHFRNNIQINDLGSTMHAHQIALSNENGRTFLYIRGNTGDGRHSLNKSPKMKAQIVIETETVDAFCERRQVFPSVLKIDVEGSEGKVLAGLAHIPLQRQPRHVFMEIHNKGDRDQMPDGSSIDEWMKSLGYLLSWSHQRGSGEHRHYALSARPAEAPRE